MTATAPRIYVASLSDYNNGNLHGVWIDATQDADAIRDDIAAMLRDSKYPNVSVDCPECDGVGTKHIGQDDETDCAHCNGTGKVPSAEEWAIHDYEGFEGLKLSEFEDIDKVAELAQAIEEHGPAYAAFVDAEGADYATPEAFEDRYRGEYDSEAAFAEELLDDLGTLSEIPEELRYYFDYEKYANDLFINDFLSVDAPGGKVWVFSRQ